MAKLKLYFWVLLLTFSIIGCFSRTITKSADHPAMPQENSPQQPSEQNNRDTAEDSTVDKSRIWDFGRVKADSILEHTFLLKNESKEKTLNITDLTTSCGCTLSEAAKKILLPGEAAEIEVRFNTKGYIGETKQFILVTTDNLDNPVIQFIIKADVEKKI